MDWELYLRNSDGKNLNGYALWPSKQWLSINYGLSKMCSSAKCTAFAEVSRHITAPCIFAIRRSVFIIATKI